MLPAASMSEAMPIVADVLSTSPAELDQPLAGGDDAPPADARVRPHPTDGDADVVDGAEVRVGRARRRADVDQLAVDGEEAVHDVTLRLHVGDADDELVVVDRVRLSSKPAERAEFLDDAVAPEDHRLVPR